MKVTLTSVSREKKTSAGGKPYTSIRIKTQEHGDKLLSGFGHAGNDAWTEGQEVEINEPTSKQVGDKVYWNFESSKPVKGGMSNEQMNELLTKLGRTLFIVEQIQQEVRDIKHAVIGKPKGTIEYPENNLGKSILDD